MEIFGIVKNSATSPGALHSDNNDMTAVTKNPQDARELKVHKAGEGDSLVQLTLAKTLRASKHASERSKAIDRYTLTRTPSFVREA